MKQELPTQKVRLLNSVNLSNVKVISPENTIEMCTKIITSKQKGAFIRFGDGEINILTNNQNASRHQSFSPKLRDEIIDTFKISNPFVLKALAIHSKKYGLEKFMKPGIHEVDNKVADRIILKTLDYFIGNNIFSAVALHYLIVYQPETAIKFFQLIKSFNPIFVGNELNSQSVIKKLFGDGTFIETPPKDAYAQIDELENKIITELHNRNHTYDVVVFSTGVTSKILIKRILQQYKNNVFLFDLGSVIEVFHDRGKWTWVNESGKDKKYWLKILNKI